MIEVSASQSGNKYYPKKYSWFQAARFFFSNRSEAQLFTKVASFLGLITLPATAGDEIGDAIPVIDILTVGDDVLAVFGIYAIFRITMIHRKINRRPAMQRT